MDESTMIADLTARLAALERQHADQLALFRAGMTIGTTEGRLLELKAILSGLAPPAESPTPDA